MAEETEERQRADEEQPTDKERRTEDEQPAEAAQLSARDLIEAAMSAVADLTEHEPESVSAMEWDGESWRVEVEVVELSRVPNTTDVLATYEVHLDDEGTLLGYHRARRYTRGQVEAG